MKTLRLSIPVRLLGALLAGLFFAATVHAKSEAGQKPAASDSSSDRALKPGMTAETIVSMIGRPLEVNPVNVAEGQAEIWVYRRLIARETRHTPTSSQSVPTFVGVGGNGGAIIGTRSAHIYSIENITTYQVTSLLMFEGKLRVAKQSQEQRRSFN